MAVLRKKDMEFYYKSDFALVVSLSDVLTNEVRVYTTDRKRYIVAEAEVIDEDTTRLWVRGNAESHILKPGRVNIEVWSRSGAVMLVALYWLEVWLSPTEVPEGQMDVTALAPYAIVDAYDMAVSAGYTGTREEYMAALLSAGTPSVDVAYLVDGSLDKTFSELADAWEEGHMLCVIDDGDVLPLSGVYDDSLVFSQVIGDELMIVPLMDDDSVEADVSELGGGCFIVPVSLSGGGAYSTTVPFAEVLDAYDSGKVVMYEHDKMRWIAQHKAVRSNVTTLFATNVKYLGSWNNSEPNMSTLRHSSNEVVAVSAVDLQPMLTAGTGIDITNNVISATGGGGGTGIESIEQTVTSDESGGINVVTITMSDGSTADFEIMNGKKGDTGPQGPKGDSGVDLGEVVLVNDLTTGGSESALSAEQGVVLKGMVDGCAHFGDDDKIILNQPLLDLIGVEGVDYAVIEDMKFSAWNGNITTATGNYLILVTMKNGLISHKGLTISGYRGWWTADVKPSTSDPTVDEDGNAVTYTKNFYNNGTRSNVAVAKPYLLFDAGTDVSNFVMAFLAFIPTPIYDVKSVNDGIRIVSSSIDGVGNKTFELLQKGIATKNNSLDTNCVIGGMKFDVASPFKLLADANSSIYLQPIPSGAQNVVVRGLQGTSSNTYHRVFILNESLTIIANDNIYGTAVVNQYVSLEN